MSGKGTRAIYRMIQDNKRISSPKMPDRKTTTEGSVRKADLTHIPLLVDLMEEFYKESDYMLNRERAAAAFHALLSDQRLGEVWLIETDTETVGYVVITLGFGMEYGGMNATLDDMFIKPAYRGKGLGKAALTKVRDACRKAGVRAMHVEVGPDNAPALAVYRAIGFECMDDRQLYYLQLTEPTHDV